MTFEVKRSPGKVCWWIMCNGQLVDTRDTRKEAEAYKDQLERNYLR